MASHLADRAGLASVFPYLEEVFRAGSAAQQRINWQAAGTAHRCELGDGCYAMEQVYDTKDRAQSVFESHRRYADIQVVVQGEEVIEVADIATLNLRDAYDEARDVILYTGGRMSSSLRLSPGEAAVLLPADGHMPGLRVDAQPGLVRKTVIKVPVAAFTH